MQKLLFLWILVCVVGGVKAQDTDTAFAKKWRVIDSLYIKANLPKTALVKVKQVYQQAKARKNEPHAIKALIYRASLEQKNTDEKDLLLAIRLLEKELETARGVSVAVLQSLLAEKYSSYLQRYRWEIGDRKPTGSKTADVTTWSVKDLEAKIKTLYQASISQAKLLQQTPVQAYEAIINGSNRQHLRPTLYDVLVHTAIDYYKTDNVFTAIAGLPDSITIKDLLADTKSFAGHAFGSKDSSNHLLAVMLFQQLAQFHLNDTDKDALVDVELQRIQTLHSWLKEDNQNTYYERALRKLAATYPCRQTAMVYYELAKHFESRSTYDYTSGDTLNRYEKVKAVALIDSVSGWYDVKNEGFNNLKVLRYEIQRPYVSTITEAVNVPGQPFRCLVQYRNAKTLYVRIIRQNRTGQERNELLHTLIGAKPLRSFVQPLPEQKDYQQHSVEIKIDALPVGMYALLVSDNATFDDSLSAMAWLGFQVSNLAMVKNDHDFFVTNRTTGKPIEKATVKWYSRTWDNDKGTYIHKLAGTKQTDKNGHVVLMSDQYTENTIVCSLGEDSVSLQHYFYGDYVQSQTNTSKVTAEVYEQQHMEVALYTDRAIFRPGQKVYVKGIVSTKDYTTHALKLVANKKGIKVYLRDMNYKVLDSSKVITNEYGSFATTFTFPSSIVTGNAYVEVLNSRKNIRVEEYKRPKFYVEINPPVKAYQLGDSVLITGQAKAYAGNVVDGAKVSYVVNRQQRIVYDWGWSSNRKSYYPVNPEEQIAFGNIVTDAKGMFRIAFKALPNTRVDSTFNPVFDFQITATVTDANGETQTGEKQLAIGYRSLQLQLETADLLHADSINKIGVKATSLDGIPQAASVTIAISPLQTPQRFIRKRYWNRPDQFILSREAYLSAFPEDDYADDGNPAKWPALPTVYTYNVQTKDTTLIKMPKLQPGYYQLTAVAKDTAGRLVQQITYVQVFDNHKLPFLLQQMDDFKQYYTTLNQPVQLHVGTAIPEIYRIRKRTVHKKEEKEVSIIEIEKQQKGIQTLAVLSDKPAVVTVAEAFVYHNRFYSYNAAVSVEDAAKQLTTTYASYRNKTEPGSKEKWTIQVKSNQGKTASAEVLTAMYDASLDAFVNHEWQLPEWAYIPYLPHQFDELNNFQQIVAQTDPELDTVGLVDEAYPVLMGDIDDMVYDSSMFYKLFRSFNGVPGSAAGISYSYLSVAGNNGVSSLEKLDEKPKAPLGFDFDMNKAESATTPPPPTVTPRTNFNETAFFFPFVYADSSGNYTIEFTMPESLTKWKWLTLAHTKDLATGGNTTAIVTQKTITIQANPPRFVREGDQMEFSAKISSLHNQEISGRASLQLMDAATGTSVDGWFQNSFPVQYFTVAPGQSTVVKFPVQIPYSFNKALTWRVIAEAGTFTDGEENTLPVLPNRTLVTAAMPLLLKAGEQQKTFRFDQLANNNSETLTTQSVTVEFTSNPIWTVLQALPYLVEFPHECAEQTFNRLYADVLADHIIRNNPNVQKVIRLWQQDSSLFKNPLQNSAVKDILLQETPWVLDAESEQQQRKNLATLLDAARMRNQIAEVITKLSQMQSGNGGFPWFEGGYEDEYITHYILTGIGKLKKAGALSTKDWNALLPIVNKALQFADSKATAEYNDLVKTKRNLKFHQLGTTEVNYLYMRSFYGKPATKAYTYWYNQAKQYWNKLNTYQAAQVALVLYRNNDAIATTRILPSVLENAIEDTATGSLHWKDAYTCFWYQSPIEHQSLMVQLLTETKAAKANIEAAKAWLLLNKQTHHWATTIATADASYALLLNNKVTTQIPQVQVKAGNIVVSNTRPDDPSGYLHATIPGNKVTAATAQVQVQAASPLPTPAYGAVYWQYFEQLDKIKANTSPLSVEKKLFREVVTNSGTQLEAVDQNTPFKVGDKVVVRLVIRAERDMQYMHLKDLRAAAMEPVNVLSTYKWQGGLGYYESTRDVATHFFIDNLRKGTYVFEYPLFLTHSGDFSVGIASLQCMYAPEFTANSDGFRISVAP